MKLEEIPGLMLGVTVGAFVGFFAGHIFTIISIATADPIEIREESTTREINSKNNLTRSDRI